MKIIGRSQAKSEGLARYFTGQTCKRGHQSERFVSSKACVECEKLRHGAYRENHRETAAERTRKWYRENTEKAREYNRRYQQKNSGKTAFKSSKRRAVKLKATPIWADLSKMQQMYLEAERLTRETGIAHHVDHIFPLQGETSCGLHVETNMVVTPWRENLEKGNSLPVYEVIDGRLITHLSQ